MFFAIWLVPLALSALVFAVVGLASLDGGSESSTPHWTLAPDGLRIAGAWPLAVGSLAAVWI